MVTRVLRGRYSHPFATASLHHLQNRLNHIPRVSMAQRAQAAGKELLSRSGVCWRAMQLCQAACKSFWVLDFPLACSLYLCCNLTGRWALIFDTETSLQELLILFYFILFRRGIQKAQPGKRIELKNSVALQRNQLHSLVFTSNPKDYTIETQRN